MKTVEVLLINTVDTGQRDRTNRPIVAEVVTRVPGCLYAPVSSEDVLNTLNMTGKTAVYQISIPKGDANDWTNARVHFNGKDFRTIGEPEEGIEENIPLKWNRKIKVERYEQG